MLPDKIVEKYTGDKVLAKIKKPPAMQEVFFIKIKCV
jgi:hypothetical protein